MPNSTNVSDGHLSSKRKRVRAVMVRYEFGYGQLDTCMGIGGMTAHLESLKRWIQIWLSYP